MLRLLTAAAFAASLTLPCIAVAAEVCGDGVDNDGDGLADDGCYPSGVTGVCESPLSCPRAGAVAPKKGQLVYRMPPDVASKVPYGNGLAFQRVHMSQYEPAYPYPNPSDFKTTLGYRFQHNYMSWVAWPGGSASQAILHDTRGKDVKFTHTDSADGFLYYQPQAGYHFDYLRYNRLNPSWELRTLTGTVYVYDWDGSTDTGKLIEIRDSVGNAVALQYNANGRLSRVTDASGNKYLQLEYFATGTELLQYVKLFVNEGGSFVQHTVVEFSYDSDKLSKVLVDGTLVQTNRYDAADRLEEILDGEGNTIALFSWNSSHKLVRTETGGGVIGYEYAASGCDGGTGTHLYYHLASSATCDADADCGSGEFCGGETDPSSPGTGSCFKVRRCLAVDSPNEDLIEAVSASCPSCVETADYAWDTGTSGERIFLDALQSADGVWTSYARNSNGLVTKMVEGDSDSDASSVPSGARVTRYFYGNPSFPGLVTEVRRLSELKPGGSCDGASTADCKRTLYTYTTEGLLDTTQEIGFTHDWDATSGVSAVSYSYTTDRAYDAKGRLTMVEGPRPAADRIEYTYYASGSNLESDYLSAVKRVIGDQLFLTTALGAYDFWGNPVEIVDPDGTVSCRDYDDSFGHLAENRVAMAGQTDCTTTDASDLVTTYTRDTWGRLVQIQKPKGNCVHYEHDGYGRLKRVKERDDCTPTSSGHDMLYTYSVDGLQAKVEYLDEAGAVTFRREKTYHPDRRLKDLINPVNPTYSRQWSYYDDGMPQSVTFENALGKTEWLYDLLNREDERRRYLTSTDFDAWDIVPGVQLDLPTKVEDENLKAIDWVWDDMGRKVKQVTPDSGATIYLYDEAGNLVKQVEAEGTAGEVVHTFSYDLQNRLTAEDYGSIDCGGEQTQPEIQYFYNELPAGVSCPTGATCQNLEGRLAYVVTKMFCETAAPDDTFDQETFYSYNDAGRTEATFVQDDSGRTAHTEYLWNKNGSLRQTTAPSGNRASWSYDAATENSDADKVTRLDYFDDENIWSYTFANDVRWEPFGPIGSFTQYNEQNGNRILMKALYNLAYRPLELLWEEDTSGTDLFEIDYTEDARGRITVRDFSHGHTSVQDSYYNFDDLSRVLCDAATSGPCPTSGSDLKSNLTAGYTVSGERIELVHNHPDYGENTYAVTLVAGKDQIDTITYGSNTVTLTWDDRGLRASDDDDVSSNDKRDYTYDGRGNVLTISGKYPVSGNFHTYTITNVYDEKNRRVFKSFFDETTGDEAQWFFYYDIFDRLIEVKHVPDVGDTSTYSLFTFYWIGQRPIAHYQLDFPGATVSRRFLHADEMNRPLEAWSWPSDGSPVSSGDTERVWAINPDLFGWDDIVQGSNIYQPLRFPGQYYDEDTVAWATTSNPARPALHENRHRYYDPFTGTYLQVDPLVQDTWEAYNYVGQNPVMYVDPEGTFAVDKLGEEGGSISIPRIVRTASWFFFNAPDFEIVPGSPDPHWIPGAGDGIGSTCQNPGPPANCACGKGACACLDCAVLEQHCRDKTRQAFDKHCRYEDSYFDCLICGSRYAVPVCDECSKKASFSQCKRLSDGWCYAIWHN